MAELQKIIRVIRKLDPTRRTPCLTLDATTGQNAVAQVGFSGTSWISPG